MAFSRASTRDSDMLSSCEVKDEPGTPLQSKTENQLSSWDDMGCMELSLSCCTEINIHIDLRLLSQLISVVS